MDEFDPILQTGEDPAAEAPREVVLRYEAAKPCPVVERYVQPEPLPGRRRLPEPEREPPVPDAARYVFAPPERDEEPPRRGRRGVRIFLGCLALLMAVSLIVTFFPRPSAQPERDDADPGFRYELRPGSSDRGGAKTTIERYPIGSGVRLRYAESRGEELTIQQVYERVNPCTVTVATALPDGSAVIGTGVIFTADGFVLTNAHVVAGGSQCYVVLDNGKSYSNVRLVGYDEDKDLAVIKIDGHSLPVAEFGDSDAMTVGDTVYAIGNPLGVELRGTLTDGIVSAINRDVTVDGVRMTLIQTNAALNNGNSGGPLINVCGQVVGINTMKMGSSSAVSVEGLGFAIPISSAAWMVDDLIEYGEVRGEPVLGLLVEASPLPTGESAILIHEVTRGSAADKAGLKSGDRIVCADGETLETTNDLLRVRRRYRAGEALRLELDRDGKRFAAELILERSAG